MVKIYFYDNVEGDQRLPHEGSPATAADLQDLGVYATNISDQAEVDRLAKERGYKNRDEVHIMDPTEQERGGGGGQNSFSLLCFALLYFDGC
jgi:1,2-dihydroxy-3-keto-5-methylthiopentene dioxygenase